VGVSYLSVTQQIDYSTSQGKLFLSKLGAFNEYYVANLSRETKKRKEQRAKQGKSNASLSPYGYQREEPGKDASDPEATRAVIPAFESHATSKYSDNDMAGILNRAGHPPSGRAESGRWTREAVRYLFNNPLYIGKVRHGDELYPGRHEPLIEEALFSKVQALRRKRGKGRGGGRRADRVYLLAGLATCHLCRLPLIGQTSKDWKGMELQYLRDVADRRGFDCSTGGRSVQTEVLDKAIGELVARLILPPGWRAQIIAGSP
jgi:hypothetical protein